MCSMCVLAYLIYFHHDSTWKFLATEKTDSHVGVHYLALMCGTSNLAFLAKLVATGVWRQRPSLAAAARSVASSRDGSSVSCHSVPWVVSSICSYWRQQALFVAACGLRWRALILWRACGLRRRALILWRAAGNLVASCSVGAYGPTSLECDWPSCCDNTLAVYSVPESLHECNLSYSWTRSVLVLRVAASISALCLSCSRTGTTPLFFSYFCAWPSCFCVAGGR